MKLHELSASYLIDAYRAKSLSPVEVIDAVIAQIEQQEPRLCATYLFDPEHARMQAKIAEMRFMGGTPRGLLEGVPVTIKENIATAGDPMPLGTAALVPTIAEADAPPAARLYEAGAIRVSKTTMPDYGMLSSGLSSFHHLSRNPWDTSKGPGGSSAGAGSAAAAGYGPLHLGTDIGGSVRLPANWCGIVGFKPSLGRVPIDPPYLGRVAGPMTRETSDAAIMMSVLAQPDRRDAMALPPQRLDWLGVARIEDATAIEWLRGKKIALLLEAGCGMPITPQVRQSIEAAGKALEKHGARVSLIKPFMSENLLLGIDLFFRVRSLVDLDALPKEQRSRCLPFILQWAEGARGKTGAEIFQAYQSTHLTRIAAVKAMHDFDFIVSAVAPDIAFKAENACPHNNPDRALEHIGFTVPYNMSEQPAVSVNWNYVVNENQRPMPVGIQVAGARFDDIGVLTMAKVIEAIRPKQLAWPS